MGEFADMTMDDGWDFVSYSYLPRRRKKNPAFYPRRALCLLKGRKLIPNLCRQNKGDDTWLMYVASPPWDRDPGLRQQLDRCS